MSRAGRTQPAVGPAGPPKRPQFLFQDGERPPTLLVVVGIDVDADHVVGSLRTTLPPGKVRAHCSHCRRSGRATLEPVKPLGSGHFLPVGSGRGDQPASRYISHVLAKPGLGPGRAS
jgi:hypothetical protein